VFDFTRSEALWLGVFLGFIAAGVISMLMYVLIKIAIVIFVVILIAFFVKKWFTHKFRVGL
jgi:hypothetical protein